MSQYQANRMREIRAQAKERANVRKVMGWLGMLSLAAGIVCCPLMLGCAHTIPAGLEAAQRGLGAVDLGLDAATETYVQAHDLCSRLAPGSLPACDRLGDRSTVLKKAEALSKAYDATAEGLRELAEAYTEVAPHFEAAAAVVKDAGLFSR